jgi:chromate transporter
MGALVALGGILLPSTTLVCLAARWGQRNRELPAVRAFKQGMGPIVIALMIATGWVLASSHPATGWRLWLLTAAVTLIVVRSKIHLLWLLGAGALLGGFGVV